MEAKKFGKFIAELRKDKNLTQAELAEKLYVTDKAISRWERGLGFPDINTIQPLADALGVTITELMESRHIEETIKEDTISVYDQMIQKMKYQRKKKITMMIMIIISFTLIVSIVFFYPFHLKDKINSEQQLQIAIQIADFEYYKEKLEPVVYQQQYTIENNTIAHTAIIQLLNQITYHRTFKTFIHDDIIEFDGDSGVVIVFDDGQNISLSEKDIIVDDCYYRLYGNSESLVEEFIEILDKIEPIK